MWNFLKRVYRGGCIRTYTGKLVNPLDLHPEDIDIQDIAHALSNMCRFNGHVNEFYSVAEHSIRCAEVAPAHERFAALLHDRSETYLPDMTRPVKYSPKMAFFRKIENRVDCISAVPFGISPHKSPQIALIDRVMCVVEQRDLMNGSKYDAKMLQYPWIRGHKIGATMPPKLAERIFLNYYEQFRPRGA